MNISKILSAALRLVFLQMVASQRVCDVDDAAFDQGRGRVIGSQQDFDTYLSNCTSIVGNLTIGPDYQGSLNITGVTRVDGLTHIAPPLSLTDILLSDVEYIRNLKLTDVGSLRQVSAPKLRTVGGVQLQPNAALYVDLPSLETVENFISLEGNIKLFHVPLLANATKLAIVNQPPPGDLVQTLRFDLPSLYQVRILTVNGRNFLSFSAPILRVVAQELKVEVAPALNIEFPTLKYTNNTSIVTYKTPDLSSLTHAEGLFQLDIREPSRVSLPQLSYAENVRIWGKPTDVVLPNLAAIYSLDVQNFEAPSSESNGLLHCSAVNAAFRRIQQTWKANSNPDCVGDIGCGTVKCSQPQDAIGSSAKIGMGAGIGAGTVVITAAIVFWWTRKRKEEKTLKQQQDAADIELEERGWVTSAHLHAGRRRDSGDSLPPYEAEERTGGLARPLPEYTRNDATPLGPSTQVVARSASISIAVPATARTAAARRNGDDTSWLGPLIGSRSVVH